MIRGESHTDLGPALKESISRIKELKAEIESLRGTLRGLLAEVEYVISTESIPQTWLDQQQPDMAIVNARKAVEVL